MALETIAPRGEVSEASGGGLLLGPTGDCTGGRAAAWDSANPLLPTVGQLPESPPGASGQPEMSVIVSTHHEASCVAAIPRRLCAALDRTGICFEVLVGSEGTPRP